MTRSTSTILCSVACSHWAFNKTTKRVELLCDAGGWTGQEGDLCPRCGRTVRVTGRMRVTDLLPEPEPEKEPPTT